MIRSPFFAVGLIAALAATLHAEVKAPEGFTAIYNGKDLAGWWGEDTTDPAKYVTLSPEEFKKRADATLENINKHWKAEGEELVNDGNGKYLTTLKNYGDFEFLIDYKTVKGADSGIYLRGYPQVQIWDTTKEGGKWGIGADKGSGGLWNNSANTPGKDPLVLADKPFGEWNKFRIIMVGERVTIWLNDKLVVDHARLENMYNRKLPLVKAGPIQLQTHGGEIRWRNVFIREIGGEEANKILKQGGVEKKAAIDEGFKPIFNGKDFDGWAGPTDNYEIIDGALGCKKGKGGTIYTKEEYGDFTVRFEFKVPANGNNGLALRYPGSGDTAYVGMCELQVLDDNYKGIDPRQSHGSAYGMVAAARGFHRPVGEWNYQEVTVKGSTIKVELNGNVILNADLSKVQPHGATKANAPAAAKAKYDKAAKDGKTFDALTQPEKDALIAKEIPAVIDYEFMSAAAHPGKDRKSGHFGFAGHGDAVQYRNVMIKKLD